MMKAKYIVKKVEVSNVGISKPPQWVGEKGDCYLMWKIKFSAHLTMLGLGDCLTPEFASELPAKEKDTFNFTSDKGKNLTNAVRKNKKMMMQFALSWMKVAQLNKLNRATRANKDCPSRKAHKVMVQLAKVYSQMTQWPRWKWRKLLTSLA